MSGKGKREGLYDFDRMMREIQTPSRDSESPNLGNLFQKLATPRGSFDRRRNSSFDSLTDTEKDLFEKFEQSIAGLGEEEKAAIFNLDIAGNSIGASLGRSTKLEILFNEYNDGVRKPALELGVRKQAAAVKIQRMTRGMLSRNELAEKKREKAGLFTEKELLEALDRDDSKIRKLFKSIAAGGTLGEDLEKKELFAKCMSSFNALSPAAKRRVGTKVVNVNRPSPFEMLHGEVEDPRVSFEEALSKYAKSREFKEHAVSMIAEVGKRATDAGAQRVDLFSKEVMLGQLDDPDSEIRVLFAKLGEHGKLKKDDHDGKKLFAKCLSSFNALSSADQRVVAKKEVYEEGPLLADALYGGSADNSLTFGQILNQYKASGEFAEYAVARIANAGKLRMAEATKEAGVVAREELAAVDAAESSVPTYAVAMPDGEVEPLGVGAGGTGLRRRTGAGAGAGAGAGVGAGAGAGAGVRAGRSGMRGTSAVVTVARLQAAAQEHSASNGASAGLSAVASAADDAPLGASVVPRGSAKVAATADAAVGVSDHVAVSAGGAEAVVGDEVDVSIYDSVVNAAVKHYNAVDNDRKLDEEAVAKFGKRKLDGAMTAEELRDALTKPILQERDFEGAGREILEDRRGKVNKEIHKRVAAAGSPELKVDGSKESITFDGAVVIATVDESGMVTDLKVETREGREPEKHITLTFPREEDGVEVGHDTVEFKYDEDKKDYIIAHSTILNVGKGKFSKALQEQIYKAVTGKELPPVAKSVSMMQAAVKEAGESLREAGAGSVVLVDATRGAVPGAGGSGRGSGESKGARR